MYLQKFAVFMAMAALITGCPCNEENSDITLTPFSGRLGYALSGPYGFEGTLTKESVDSEWILEGTFEFPNPAWAVSEPQVVIMESYPEQVRVEFIVFSPPPDVVVPQVISEKPVSASIQASAEARFDLSVKTFCWNSRQ